MSINLMDSYELEITETAEKQLKKFNREIQKHFFKKIGRLKLNPMAYGKPLRNILEVTWEIYFEHRYRILYSIDRNKRIIVIESILHKDDF